MKLSHPLAPVFVAVAAIALLSVMDGTMKGASLAVGAYSALLWRAAMSSAVTLPLWLGAPNPVRRVFQAMRVSVCEVKV